MTSCDAPDGWRNQPLDITGSQSGRQEKRQSKLRRLVKLRETLSRYFPDMRGSCHMLAVPDEILCEASNEPCDKHKKVHKNKYNTPHEYVEKMTTLLWHEEVEQMIEMRDFDMFETNPKLKIVRTIGGHVRRLTIPDLSLRQPSIVHSDIIVLDPLVSKPPARPEFEVIDISRQQQANLYALPVKSILAKNKGSGRFIKLPYPRSNQRQTAYSRLNEIRSSESTENMRLSPKVHDSFFVHTSVWPEPSYHKVVHIEGDTLTIGDPFSLPKSYPNQKDIEEASTFNVYCISANTPYQKCRSAVKLLESNSQLSTLWFRPDSIKPTDRPLLNVVKKRELKNRLSLLSLKQRTCVLKMLEGKCRPFPYILHGPPGTGKTTTIIETIVQLHKRDRSLLVLICASSDVRSEDLYNKLVATAEFDDGVVRRVTPTTRIFHIDLYSSELKSDSENEREHGYDNSVDEDNQVRIVVTNNIAAERLSNYFNYVFIDEAGHTSEPEALIPWSKLSLDGCVVLAGDPHQVAPVVKSALATKGGLGRSVLDRFVTMSHYMASNSGEDDYDSRFITKLDICYRCDPRLMVVSNQLFYNNALQCRGRTPPSIMRILNLERPIGLVDVRGEQSQTEGPKSWFNTEEVNVCLSMLRKLYSIGIEPSQVAMISLCTQQRFKLRKALKAKIEENHFEAIEERFRVQGNRSQLRGSESSSNTDEVKVFLSVLKKLYDIGIEPSQVATASLYFQESKLEETLSGKIKENSFEDKDEIFKITDNKEQDVKVEKVTVPIDWMCDIEIVGSFQGGEKEVIILSTARDTDVDLSDEELCALIDERCFNASISLAKWLFIVVGDLNTLTISEHWWRLLDEAQVILRS